jgi:acetylornithine deacetylase/succinyl-diaminopimelate desuccinylase-like protein
MNKPAESHVAEFFEFLRFASISTDPASRDQTLACADWLTKKLNSIGMKAEQLPTAGYPVVLARNEHRAGRPTVLIYGHYDVQPADPLALWRSKPFEPTVVNGVVTARGATDNKGQILAHILGVQEILSEKKELPVNLIFLVEGEEEIGSPNLTEFLRKHREQLRCDVVVVSDGSMVAQGCPTITYGLRGLVGLELMMRGPAKDLHSGLFGGAVLNPLTAMARLVATMHGNDFHVAIKGFYDDVRPLEEWERTAWKKIPMNEADFQKLSGAPALGGEAGFTFLERLWARPTAEVNGLYGGYQGVGGKTVLPSEAHAKITFRLVPNQDPEKILALAEKHFRDHAPPQVTLEIKREPGRGQPYLVDLDKGYGRAAIDALRQTFPGKEPARARGGASIPVVADFKQILGADTLLLDLGDPDCNMHSPNETFPLANLQAGIDLNKNLLQAFAGGIDRR